MRIGIADDDGVVLDYFSKHFEKLSYIKEVQRFNNLSSLLEFVKRKPGYIEYLFLDIYFGSKNSITLIPQLRQLSKYTEIIMFTSDEGGQHLIKSFMAGASGYLPKSLNMEDVECHLTTCLQGGAALTPPLARKLIEFYHTSGKPSLVKKTPLTKREMQILKLISQGQTNQEIAALVGTGVDNIKYHVKKIFQKMSVKSRTEAVRNFLLGDNEL